MKAEDFINGKFLDGVLVRSAIKDFVVRQDSLAIMLEEYAKQPQQQENTETVELVKNKDGYEICTMHDQSGSSNGFFMSEDGMRQLSVLIANQQQEKTEGADESHTVEIRFKKRLDEWTNGTGFDFHVAQKRWAYLTARDFANELSNHLKATTQDNGLRDAAEKVVEMQKRNYGDGMKTHLELLVLAKELETQLNKKQ